MVMHMYAWGLERMASEVPEIAATPAGNGTTVLLTCTGLDCEWQFLELATLEDELVDAIVSHKQWHEEGMQP